MTYHILFYTVDDSLNNELFDDAIAVELCLDVVA